MKRSTSGNKGAPDIVCQDLQPDKVGWIRKFCGQGIFREIWKNRFVVLQGEHLFLCEKEVKDPGSTDEFFDLSEYERCEEMRTNKSRSKKSHSKFRLTAATGQNLILLAVSPEEKESWINVLNVAITRAKNQILDQVTVNDTHLSHLTRDRVKIPRNRRLPTKGHLLAVASKSSPDGMLIWDLIQEEDAPSKGPPHCPFEIKQAPPPLSVCSFRCTEASGKSRSLPRDATVVWEQTQPAGKRLTMGEKSRCVSMDHIQSHPHTAQTVAITTHSGAATPINQLQELIHQKLRRTEHLLTEVRQEGREPAERLLKEAEAIWHQAHEVLEEVKDLRSLCRQLDPSSSDLDYYNRV